MIIESLRSLAVPIDSLRGLPGNPRRGDVDAVASSLSRFGQRKPIVVRKDDGTIIAGNHTWQAAKKLGWSEIAVAYVGDDDVTAQAYALADNRTAELGDYDDELLKQLIESVGQIDPDLLHDTGWSDDAVKELLDKIESELPKVVDEDEVPEPPTEPKTKLGDLYHLGRHRLLCGDSTDEATVARLMDGEKADMVFTDPPYGVSYVDSLGRSIENDNLTGQSLLQFIQKAFEQGVKQTKKDTPWFVWHADKFSCEFKKAMENVGIKVRQQIIWVKGQGEENSSKIAAPAIGGSHWRFLHEPCWYGSTGTPFNLGDRTTTTVWTVTRPTTGTVHPTQKPIPLVNIALLNSSVKNNIILDLFGGSGSTLIAAEQTDRTCYMMELDPKYCDVIIQRWETLTGEKAVLISNAESTQA